MYAHAQPCNVSSSALSDPVACYRNNLPGTADVWVHHFVIVQDPLALVNWMQALFGLADAGCTTFDVHGRFWPYGSLSDMFGRNACSTAFQGAEQILGIFKRRLFEVSFQEPSALACYSHHAAFTGVHQNTMLALQCP